jgi:hypothetical protein
VSRAARRALALCLGVAAACSRGAAGDDGPRGAPEAMAQWARCAFDGVGEGPTPEQLEGAMRLALRRDRGRWVVRAGRCEDALTVRGETPACLRPLRARWSAMLPVAQRSVDDAIEMDVAVRRVGEAWSAAQRACR